MDLISVVVTALPVLLTLVAGQKAPDKVIPIPSNPVTTSQKMTITGAAIVLLAAFQAGLQAVESGGQLSLDLPQIAAALLVIYASLPRAHELVDKAFGLRKR